MATDKRFQVFVSSTYVDLREERQAVTSALLQLDAFPSGMELFPAADDDAWTLIKRVIDDSDYYLLVIGGKYGSIDPVDDISYTEKEFDYAVANAKPVMAFLHANPDSIPVGKTDKSSDAAQKLESFRKKVQAAKHVKYWNNGEHLAGQVALSFAQFTKQYPAVGWIRANQAASPEVLSEVNELRKKLSALEGQLAASQSGPPPGSEHLSQGGDEVSLPTHAILEWRKHGQVYTTYRYSKWDSIKTTWDKIFGGVSTKLLDECAEGDLHEALNRWFLHEFWVDKDYDEEAQAEIKDAGYDYDDGRVTEVALTINDSDFGTMLIQFVALGLIEKSAKRRSVSDTGTYWTLTRYGQTKAIQLRALPRKGDVNP